MSPADGGTTTVRRALLSVTDKTGIADFARGLAERDFQILSTGGTAKVLREAGLAVTDVAEVTGFPEMMDGRLKTLHPNVHGGLLFLRNDEGHVAAMEQHGIGAIDVVAVNLYAFEATVARADVTVEQAIENIDIGGPSMIRSAAKNHRWVWVVTDPTDYASVLKGLDAEHGSSPDDPAVVAARRALATKAYLKTAEYDTTIGAWFAAQTEQQGLANPFAGMNERQSLRYGENPNQKAVFVKRSSHKGASIATANQLSGKELSYNNIMDADAALALVSEFSAPTVAVIKHTNPCGCGTADDLAEAFRRAWSGDPQSAFGGILAVNRPMDTDLATTIATPDAFLEVIIAPSFSDEAVEILKTGAKWGKNVRLLAVGPIEVPDADGEQVVRAVAGGAAVAGQGRGLRRREARGGVEPRAEPGRAGRPRVRVARLQTRQEQCHRAGEGRRGGGGGGRADEPGRLGVHGGPQGW
jgi:phosphoribosylaminoimidazolecarboxamide formyltransferase/IMP cyclohydrolase